MTTLQNTLRTLWPATTHLRSTDPRETPKSSLSCGQLPGTKSSPGCHGPPPAMKVSCSLWGGAGCPGAESVLGDAALAGWSRDTASPRWCTHVDSTRPTQSQIWPSRGGFNIKKIMPSFRLHMSQVPHRDKALTPVPHILVFPHVSLAPL
ncbi:hypothetical protein mRhiFer1_010197 [Rhinolophus ferrumequinum]|uniref:Uncharacterized protein n=1 Tax=Rhinolophus ferrumequinum TaxID=59479 RepID=A0A7J7XPQ3_RHIFE|nr:hypothetical protein mRhiFer1_010197 [Rhinolophus ferrumequinum]